MKKTLIILLAALFGNILGKAQNVSVVNNKTIGGNQDDQGLIYKLANGDYVLHTLSFSNISGDRTVPLRGGADAWLLKLGSDFTIKQQVAYGTSAINFSGLYQGPNCFYLLCNDNVGISLDRTVPFKGAYQDIWLLKLDTNLNIVWQQAYGADSGAIAHSMHILPDGNMLLAARSSSPASIDKTDSSRGMSDYWLLKLDTAGNKIWDITLGGSLGETRVSALASDSLGNIYIAGESFSSVSGEKSEPNFDASNSTRDIWLLKLDSNGNVLWDKTLGGISDEIFPILLFQKGYLYMACNSTSPVSGNKTQSNFASSFGSNIWLVKLNATNGTIIWDKVYGGSGGEAFFDLLNNNNNSILILSSSRSPISGNKTENTQGGGDYWLVNIDTTGTILWQKDIGGTNDDYLASAVIEQVSDSVTNYILSGISNSNAGADKTENSRGGDDAWLVKLSVITTGIKEYSHIKMFLYPNPVSNLLHIDFSEYPKEQLNLNITNISGQVVYNSVLNTKNNTINTTHLTPGNYIIQITDRNNKQYYTAKFVKQ